jgi:hypothetical protein
MIYLKRFLYLLITSIWYTLMIPTVILYIVYIPFGMVISFILSEDFTRYFNPLAKLEEYTKFIYDKLESIFLK